MAEFIQFKHKIVEEVSFIYYFFFILFVFIYYTSVPTGTEVKICRKKTGTEVKKSSN